jgi:selenocysteine lyase/cysteine desulfurase
MLKYRGLFNLPESVCYLNSAFISPQLKQLTECGRQSMLLKEQPWSMQASDFFSESDTLRAIVGRLFEVSAENIAMIPAVSYGVETAVKNLPLKAGQSVLMPAGEFPSNVYPWMEVCKEQKAEVIFVQKPTNHDWTAAFLETITVNTAVVSVPQTDWSDGSHFDLKAIGEKARSVGAAFVVDLSQSFGVSPVDLKTFDPDFVFSVGYKWQLGPYGISYMFVADRHLEGKPLENNWLNRKTSEDFTRLTEYTNDYAKGARRFDSGQHSQFVLVPLAIRAMEFLNELRPEAIAKHIGGLNEVLDQGLQALGFETIPKSKRTGHMMGARPGKNICVKELCDKLHQEQIFASVRGENLRISPHIYNSKADIERVLRVLKSNLKKTSTHSFGGSSFET